MDTNNQSPANNQVARYHLVLFQTSEEDMLSRGCVWQIQGMLDEVITTPPEETDIDIWIESPGGDAHAAYKLFLDLRSRCRHLRAIVPDWAKSAATLLLLGVDEIYMAPSAELGPLDVQIGHPDREDSTVSGLDVAKQYDFLIRTAILSVLSAGKALIRVTRLNRTVVFHDALQFTATFLQPVVSKLDPHLIHRAAQELQVASNYAVRMLACRNLDKESQLNSDEAKGLLDKLVNQYPTHGFVISQKEATDLGLPIKDARSHPHWEIIRLLHKIAVTQEESMVEVLADDEVIAMASAFDKDRATAQEGSNDESIPATSANGRTPEDIQETLPKNKSTKRGQTIGRSPGIGERLGLRSLRPRP